MSCYVIKWDVVVLLGRYAKKNEEMYYDLLSCDECGGLIAGRGRGVAMEEI